MNPNPDSLHLMRGLLSVALFALHASNLAAATFHVAGDGNNAADGLTPATAFATLQHGADIAEPGDTFLVADGDYDGFNVTRSGAPGQPITFRAVGSGARIVAPNGFTDRDGINIEGGSWIVIDGFTSSDQPRAGIRAVLGDHNVIRNNTCENNGRWGIFTGFTDDLLVENNLCARSVAEHGIYVSNSSDRVILRGNRSHHNRGGGIQINADASMGGDGISSDCRIHDNVLWENGLGGGAAINLDGAVDCAIYNNLLYENHATGIALFQIDAATSSRGAIILHNTIVQAANGRWNVLIVDGATGVTLRNNLLVTQHSFRGVIAVDAASRAGLSSDYNIVTDRLGPDGDDAAVTLAAWRTATGQDTHSRVAAPLDSLFRDRAAGDYRLAAGSQALNAGTILGQSWIATDALGVARPQGPAFDIGAFESVVDPAPAATARFVNLSTRARAVPADPVIAGFVIVGEGARTVLVRVAGPTLRPMGVPTALEDPALRLYAGQTLLAENDDWESDPDSAALVALADAVGAFPLPAGSADAALVATLPPGIYSAHGLAKNGSGGGPVLVELYDAGGAPGTSSRLANVSTRAVAGVGDDTVIAGFVIDGEASPVLLRSVGPGLADYDVSNFLADPQLVLFADKEPIRSNGDWSSDPDAAGAAMLAAQVGAFALRAGTRDAALRLELAPGLYSVHAGPAGNTSATGSVLVEVYAP